VRRGKLNEHARAQMQIKRSVYPRRLDIPVLIEAFCEGNLI